MIDIASLRLFFIQLKQVLVRPYINYIKVSLKIVRTLGEGGRGAGVEKFLKSVRVRLYFNWSLCILMIKLGMLYKSDARNLDCVLI